MKKREAKRKIDLTSNIPRIAQDKISFLIENISDYSVDYNELMEEYENKDTSTEYLFMLPEHNDPAVYQLIPLFCIHFGINLYQIDEKLRIKSTAPFFIRVKKGDKMVEKVSAAVQLEK
ncbi:hypothetical protein NEPAR06_2117 [Nematocida parisii]|uniref:Uncharacterized protein n=1 Tax=Nematocida parisii (strain ERTm3) TaxID=935791 RepID=I3EK19_NEMP3|nr:uncharacterized protein NEPG_00904 [Nematocida parisii ERTm1]EIJ89566.1 hypothetical protein NEQG_00336 [Nematocida parisii ERTm3]KAI5127534.1 hypothetical protein NEPAR03_0980 [Nematocida parisii]EIJ94237.1 hypothetical protein NEPG_00904 [Nematocida parisii ERTm1]KAI5142665.1 hypothetical protein NEPAR04_1588 [Nematocida parisii]KAI5146087.1 hypothetical protein NEPAR07_2097 [Nematocida parisii]|eukprot:XP_013058733.1 hypothetical protein NEPG_00904 [Nematocida parisii ERTm1]